MVTSRLNNMKGHCLYFYCNINVVTISKNRTGRLPGGGRVGQNITSVGFYKKMHNSSTCSEECVQILCRLAGGQTCLLDKDGFSSDNNKLEQSKSHMRYLLVEIFPQCCCVYASQFL